MTVPFFARLKTIVESAAVSTEVDAARTKFARFDDAWDALQWLLARRSATLGVAPSVGQDGFRLYVQEGDAEASAPAIWILFRVGDEDVELIAVKFEEAAEDEAAE